MSRPDVDEGDPPDVLALLRRELAPAPGRFGNTLRLVVLVLLAVSISETFRLPEPALSAYVVLFVSRTERASTVMTAVVAGVAVSVAILVCLLVLMASLSQPAFRLPLVAGITCAAMFLARVSPLGPALFAGGFIIAYGLTFGDEVLGLSLQSGSAGNVADFGLPLLVFLPPEEALVHFLLWLALVVAMPVILVIAANLLTGRDPAVLLHAALAARLSAAARLCEGETGAQRELALLAREGTADLLKLHHLSRGPRRRGTDGTLIADTSRFCLVLLAALRLPAGALAPDQASAIAAVCRRAARALQDNAVLPAAAGQSGPALPADPAAGRVLTELWRALGAILSALSVRPGTPAPADAASTKPPFLAPDAFTNATHLRFALKVTLAVMICYAIQDLTDWPGIHTCIITCFFVSLGTVGETLHKAALRLAGCLAGAALGIATILLLMPAMTDLGDLLVVLAGVTFLAGWIASGGERSAYAGWQLGLAFYLTVLQGTGPTLDMQTARDRVIGILLGNIVVAVIFTTIWPVSVADTVRRAVAAAIEQLGHLADLPPVTLAGAADPEPALRAAFGTAIEQARAMLVNDIYERPFLRRARNIDAAVLLELQALIVPVTQLVDLSRNPAAGDPDTPERATLAAHQHALAQWFERCANWVRSGAGGETVAASLPAPPQGPVGLPGHLTARLAWFRLLDQDLRTILRQVLPQTPVGGAAADAS